MYLTKKLTSLFRRRPFRNLQIEERVQIIEAFVYKGTTYYTFDDIFKMATSRALQALDYYDEFSMRCTKEYLGKLCESFEVILSNNKKLDLIKLATLVKQMKERLDMIPTADHIYRLASVMFFDASESPYIFDRNYSEKKIALWKKDPEVLDFFLQQPLKGLIPYLDSQKINFHTYSVVSELLNKEHMKTILELLSQQGMTIAM